MNNNNSVRREVFTYNGVEYPMMYVNSQIIAPEEFKGEENLMLCITDYELWVAISNHFLDVPKGEEEEEIDNSIYYYCDSGFVASNPSIEELKEYFKNI